MVRINTFLCKLTKSETRRIANLILKWCIQHLGENKRIKKPLKLDLDYKTDEKAYCGEYDIEEDVRVIRIFMSNTKTIKDLISSILHEYKHNLQPVTTQYDKLYAKYGYENHPYEKAARKIEKTFTQICFDDIRPKIEKVLIK